MIHLFLFIACFTSAVSTYTAAQPLETSARQNEFSEFESLIEQNHKKQGLSKTEITGRLAAITASTGVMVLFVNYISRLHLETFVVKDSRDLPRLTCHLFVAQLLARILYYTTDVNAGVLLSHFFPTKKEGENGKKPEKKDGYWTGISELAVLGAITWIVQRNYKWAQGQREKQEYAKLLEHLRAYSYV